jgi:hypothetical protein
MSTSPEAAAADQIVSVLSRWLAGHADDDELRRELASVETQRLESQQASAVAELVAELDRPPQNGRGALEMVVRETLEAVALGG